MNNIIDSVKGSGEPFSVADVTNEESEFVLVLGKLVAHDELLVFITGVDDNLFRVVMFEDVLNEVVPKGASSASDEDGFVV